MKPIDADQILVAFETWKGSLPTNQTARVVAIIERYAAKASALQHGWKGCGEPIIDGLCNFPIKEVLECLRRESRVRYKTYQVPGTETRTRYWRMSR